ncbi:MAG: DPP IV N-terminal domain-containing protein, partial [Halocynthiibacter sp.]
PLTQDGEEDFPWDADAWKAKPWTYWSPDGAWLAATKYDIRGVHQIPLLHWLKREEEVSYEYYPLVGGPTPRVELKLINVFDGRTLPIDIGSDNPYVDIVGFRKDGSELLFTLLSRDTKRLDLIAAKVTTGTTRIVMTETTDTFLYWSPYYRIRGAPIRLLRDGQRFIFQSDRNGWSQLYLYDLDKGYIRQLTDTDYPVTGLSFVDESKDLVYFTAHSDSDRPYDMHLHKIGLNGRGLERLSEPAGQHTIAFAPSGQFYLDTHSSLDRPPVVELRSADGTLIRSLSQANIKALKTLGWEPPESFVVKAADGKTNLFGVLYKPNDFDPNKQYPVVEYIYAGPQVSVVQKSFNPTTGQSIVHFGFPRALAQLGFVVFVVDGRGTPGRSKSFQDVAYRSIGKYEIGDHVAALKQVASTRPYMDMNRVGIFGVSFGGYFTIRALLKAPDIYQVGVASAPAEFGPSIPFSGSEITGDISTDPAAFQAAGNIPLAGNLEGKLRIIIGTNDVNTPFSHSMRLADAFVRAERQYDMVVIPGANHIFMYRDSARPVRYWFDAIREFLIENLDP